MNLLLLRILSLLCAVFAVFFTVWSFNIPHSGSSAIVCLLVGIGMFIASSFLLFTSFDQPQDGGTRNVSALPYTRIGETGKENKNHLLLTFSGAAAMTKQSGIELLTKGEEEDTAESRFSNVHRAWDRCSVFLPNKNLE